MRPRLPLRAVLCALAFAMVVPPAARGAEAAFDEAALRKLLPAVAQYQAGQSRKPLIQAQELVARASKDPKQGAVAARLVATLLDDPKATWEAKDFACRQLWIVGTAEQVPALAKLLDEAKLSHMARYALERLPDPAADEALRQALGRLKGDLLVGVLASIGERRDAEATDALVKLLGAKDPEVAAAAGAALGKVGGERAAEALAAARQRAEGRLKDVLTEAWLSAAESLLEAGKTARAARIYAALYDPAEPHHVRVAALGGRLRTRGPAAAARMLVELIRGDDARMRVVAVRHLRHVPGEQVTAEVAAILPDAEPALQSLLLGVLAARGDTAAGPIVTRLARDAKDPEVRVAAVRALAAVGDASAVPLLARLAASGSKALREAARHSLSRLRGEDVNAAILQALQGAEPATRVELVRALRIRRATNRLPAIEKLAATEKSPEVRAQCFAALGDLAGGDRLAQLAQLMIQEADGGARGAAERAVLSVARRIEDAAKRVRPLLEAHAKAQGAARVAALHVLARLGGAQALQAVTGDLEHADEAVREGALRALTLWPDGATAKPLLQQAKAAQDPTLKILALRGSIRALGLASERSPEEVVRGYQQAIELATRPDEKKLALAGLAKVAHPDALALARRCAQDPKLKAEAEQAAKKIQALLAKPKGKKK